jgi:hypothetical protein
MHASAVKNPKLLGEPFMDLDGDRTDEIKALKTETGQKREALLGFSAAIAEADALLRSNAQSQSLQPLYGLLPQSLRGYLELVYDLEGEQFSSAFGGGVATDRYPWRWY